MGLFGDKNQPPAPASAAPRPTPTPTATPSGSSITLVAQASRFDGSLSGTSDVHIAGQLKGEVDCAGQLVVAESGKVQASMHARSVVVAGSVKGDVSADEKIELKPSANLHGNITAPRILIQEGATFEGQVFMKAPDKRPAGQPKPDEPKTGPGAGGSGQPEQRGPSSARHHKR